MTVDHGDQDTSILGAALDREKLGQLAHRSSLLTLDALIAALPGSATADGDRPAAARKAPDTAAKPHAAAARTARRLARRAEGSARAFGLDSA